MQHSNEKPVKACASLDEARAQLDKLRLVFTSEKINGVLKAETVAQLNRAFMVFQTLKIKQGENTK